jgi:hypothetical protein
MENIEKKTYSELESEGLVNKYSEEFIEVKVHFTEKEKARNGIACGDFHWQEELRWYIVGKVLNRLSKKE